MTAISPIVLPSSRINSDQSAADSANTAAPAAQTDFAGTLQGVTAKPARKLPAGKDAPAEAHGGGTLPQAGKPAPAAAAAPPVPPAQTNTPAAPNAAATSGVPATPIPAKGKQAAKPIAPVTQPAAVSNPLAMPVVPMPDSAPPDPKGGADAKTPAPNLPAISAMAANGAPPAATTLPDASLASPTAAGPDAVPGSKPAPAQADKTAALFNQGPSDASGAPAANPATATAATAAATPAQSAPPNPVPAQPSVTAIATAQTAPSNTASVQASTAAAVSGHAGKEAVHGQNSPKAVTPTSAKTRTASTGDSHPQAGAATPSGEGDGAEPHAVQAPAGNASPAANAVLESRGSPAGGTDPTQVSALVVNAKSPDVTPDAQAPDGDTEPGVNVAGAASGAAVNAAPGTPSFANLVSETLDKHGAAKSDAAGANVDPSGALQSASQVSAGKAPDAPAAPTFKLGPSVDSSEFGQGVANQVSMMVDSNITSAKLQVSPPALGPIEVRIALQGDHATVQFTSHSAVTREALADSTPKLREMLSSQGFGQVSVDISHRSFQERPSNAQAYEWGGKSDGAKTAPSAAIQSRPAARGARSGVDAYA